MCRKFSSYCLHGSNFSSKSSTFPKLKTFSLGHVYHSHIHGTSLSNVMYTNLIKTIVRFKFYTLYKREFRLTISTDSSENALIQAFLGGDRAYNSMTFKHPNLNFRDLSIPHTSEFKGFHVLYEPCFYSPNLGRAITCQMTIRNKLQI